jgi:hypothetical protein
MPEPYLLKRGKEFQKIVQVDFNQNNKSGILCLEQHVSFEKIDNIKQERGRMDLFIHDDSDDYVSVFEIKATDWDKIKEKNIKRNLYRHSKQLFNYIEKFLSVDNKDVCHGIIYPSPPKKKGLRDNIENWAMDLYSFPVYWYNEIKG